MRNPASIEGNLVRFGIFSLLLILTKGAQSAAIHKGIVQPLFLVIFLILAIISLIFYDRQYNREQQYFSDLANARKPVWNNTYWFILIIMIIVGILALGVFWYQGNGKLPLTGVLVYGYELDSNAFWCNLLMAGIVVPIMTQYVVTGFFFDYFFRKSNIGNFLGGMLVSGFFYALFSWTPLGILSIINWVIGSLFAMTYLHTRRLEIPIYLNVFFAILAAIIV